MRIDPKNEGYPTMYRHPGMISTRADSVRFGLMMLAGAAGWVMVGLLIWWAIKS